MATKKVTVAQYIEQMVALSDKSQKEIAAEMGYEKPNIITMFKQGATKLPINKVSLFARAVGADPVHLLRIVMQEYMPETWESLEPLVGQSLVTQDELAAIRAIRRASGGVDLHFATDRDLIKGLEDYIAARAETDVKDRRSAAKAVATGRVRNAA